MGNDANLTIHKKIVFYDYDVSNCDCICQICVKIQSINKLASCCRRHLAASPERTLVLLCLLEFSSNNYLLLFIAVTLLLFSFWLFPFLLLFFLFPAAVVLLILILILSDCAEGKVVCRNRAAARIAKKRPSPCSFFFFGFN